MKLALAATLTLLAASAQAAAIHVNNANVSSWNVGTGQLNGNFSVTTDSAFGGVGIELGLRGERRREGAIVPDGGGNSYTALSGADVDTNPPAANRAWWNFQGSIAYNAPISTLDALTLQIIKDAGTNNAPSGTGIFDLLIAQPLIDDRNPGTEPDGNFLELYQFSQNPVFAPWFAGGYDLDPADTFAYRFIVTATEGRQSVATQMCVHTPGLACASAVPEPGSIGLLFAGLIGLAAYGRKLTRRS